jgi:hypothetical protein
MLRRDSWPMRRDARPVMSAAMIFGCASLVACGSSHSDPADAGVDSGFHIDASIISKASAVDANVDHGSPSTKYPAFAPEVPQVVNNGGAVLANPVFVTITWKGDTNAPGYEAFGDALGTSSFWSQIVHEYGVGAGSSGSANHVRMNEDAPASWSDSDVDAFVVMEASDPTSGWPSPTSDLMYVLYLPTGTTLLYDGESACLQGVGGYHTSTNVNGVEVAYAVIPQCRGTTIDDATLIASHELGEGSADPHPGVATGWYGFDGEHAAWTVFQDAQTETADACEFFPDADYRSSEPNFAYLLQRQWSNASAMAGHDPCVPARPEPYFNVTPLDLEQVKVNLIDIGGPTNLTTRGYSIALGKSKTIQLGFTSDAATDPWQIEAYESDPLLGQQAPLLLDFSVDTTTGQNGTTAYLTVTVDERGPGDYELLTIESTLGSTTNYMPILISTP